jgi:2-polyprenyl-3-methyl-5-hydroxy-6-metoxy-1,4-benzoquinol methylase
LATFYQEAYDLRPWYHDFEKLGLQTRFDRQQMGLGERLTRVARMLRTLRPRQILGTRLEKREIYALLQMVGASSPGHFTNQPVKEQALVPYLTRCLDSLQGSPTCLDLFCADGYYSCMMAQMNPNARVTGIDLAAMEIKRAETAARLLDLQNVTFVGGDAWELFQEPRQYDLVLCAGGLYHLEEPRRFVDLLRRITRHYLVIQSVVTIETDDPDYFVTPAPGLRHGSRFTQAALEKWLTETGWEVLGQAQNELPGNRLARDRGSCYFLCQPPSSRRS